MPTYGYECETCGYTFEKFQKMSDPPITKCSNCKGTTRRLIEAGTGVIIKGSGIQASDNIRDNPSRGSCCGRAEQCEKPPCSENGVCKR